MVTLWKGLPDGVPVDGEMWMTRCLLVGVVGQCEHYTKVKPLSTCLVSARCTRRISSGPRALTSHSTPWMANRTRCSAWVRVRAHMCLHMCVHAMDQHGGRPSAHAPCALGPQVVHETLIAIHRRMLNPLLKPMHK